LCPTTYHRGPGYPGHLLHPAAHLSYPLQASWSMQQPLTTTHCCHWPHTSLQTPEIAGSQPIIMALPRGGVPLAWQVAQALGGAPLDVLIVRKIGAPLQPEYGIGAIAEGEPACAGGGLQP
jgi:hypothetical protein